MATNLRNGMVYVGATTMSMPRRKWYHESKWAKSLLACAIRRDGKSNFSWAVVDTAETEDELAEKETEWMKKMNSFHPHGYNLQTGGKRNFKSHSSTVERLRHPKTEAHRLKISRAKKGIKAPAVSASNIRRSGQKESGGKHWRIFCPDGTVVEMYGLKKFCRDRGMSRAILASTATKKRRHHHGYRVEEIP